MNLPDDLTRQHTEYPERLPNASYHSSEYQHPGYRAEVCVVCGGEYLRGRVTKGVPPRTCGRLGCMEQAKEWPSEVEVSEGDSPGREQAPQVDA